MSLKVTSLRLEDGLARELAVIARADGEPVSELIREAIDRYVADRLTDEKLHERCEQLVEEDAALVGRMRRRGG